jgi:hypothetical protein
MSPTTRSPSQVGDARATVTVRVGLGPGPSRTRTRKLECRPTGLGRVFWNEGRAAVARACTGMPQPAAARALGCLATTIRRRRDRKRPRPPKEVRSSGAFRPAAWVSVALITVHGDRRRLGGHRHY